MVQLVTLPSDGSTVTVDLGPTSGSSVAFIFDATPGSDVVNTTYYIDTSIYTTITTALYRLAERMRSLGLCQ